MNIKYCTGYLNMDTRNTRSISSSIICLLFFNYILSRNTCLKVWNLKVSFILFYFLKKFNP